MKTKKRQFKLSTEIKNTKRTPAAQQARQIKTAQAKDRATQWTANNRTRSHQWMIFFNLSPTIIPNIPEQGYQKSGNPAHLVLAPRAPIPTSVIPTRAMWMTPTMFLNDKEVHYNTARGAPNFIEPFTNILIENWYCIRSRVHYVIDSTTPVQTHIYNTVLVNTIGKILVYRHLIKGPDADI